MRDLWALLWSKRQNCLHIEPVDEWLSKNRSAYRDERDLMDYHPVYIGSKELCHATADSARQTITNRDKARQQARAEGRIPRCDVVPLPVVNMPEESDLMRSLSRRAAGGGE